MTAVGPPPVALRKAVAPINQHHGCARVALVPPHPKIQILILSGLSGRGYEGYVAQTTKMLRTAGFAVAFIDTNLFLGVSALTCTICRRATELRGTVPVARCTMCPEAIDVDTLNTTINRVSGELLNSADFAEGVERGVVILEGSFPLAIQNYNLVAKSSKWWYAGGDSTTRKINFLRQQRRLGQKPSPDGLGLPRPSGEQRQRSPVAFFLPRG